MSEIELAWVAGLLEGEGSFKHGATWFVNNKPRRSIQVTCSMTDKDVIDKLASITGVGNVNPEGYVNHDIKYRRIYAWGITKRVESVELMKLLLPLMGERRAQKIEELLKYAEDNPPIYPPGVPHGTKSAYDYHKCRCELCTAAVREIGRKRRERIKNEKVEDSPN